MSDRLSQFPVLMARSAACLAAPLSFAGAMTAAAQPIFDVPRLPDGIRIDGRADDWQGQGLRTGPLLDPEQGQPAAGFTSEATLGWDDLGLCVALEIRGGKAVEADRPGALYEASSIELFASTAHHNQQTASDYDRRNVLQAVIAPGRDPRQPSPRIRLYDQRLPEIAVGRPAECEYAVSREGGRTSLEVRIPWSQLGIEPARGATVGLQIHANDAGDAGRLTQLRWNTAPGKGHTLRLAGADARPAPPVAATAAYHEWKSVRVRIKADAPGSFRIHQDGAAHEVTTDAYGAAVADIPLPPWGQKAGPLRVTDGSGRDVAWIELPDATRARRSAIEALPITFSGDNVFAGDAFPPMDPLPAAAENLVAPAKTRVRFFNARCEETKVPDLSGRYYAVVTLVDPEGKETPRRIDLFRSKTDLDLHLAGSDVELAEAAGIAPPESAWDRELFAAVRKGAPEDWKKRIFSRAAILSALHERDSSPVRVMSSRLNAWYRLDKTLGTVEPVRHVALMPSGAAGSGSGLRPVVVFLHGTGGHTEATALKEPIRTTWAAREDRDFILLQPLAPRGSAWVPDQIVEWLDDILPTVGGDPQRVVLTGFSMGGIGTWNIACRHPQRFAAFVPLAGVGERAPVDAVKSRPAWCFHGSHDAMPYEPAEHWIADLKNLDPSADVRFTLLDDTDHARTSERVYGRNDLQEWLRRMLHPESRAQF